MANSEKQTLPNGSRIGVYEIRRTDVSSDFSIVYLGWNHHLNAKVSVEEYFPHQFAKRNVDAHAVEPLTNESQEDFDEGLSNFIEQGESLSNIAHPNIVTVDNVLEANGTAYLVTKHADELPLSRLCVTRRVQFDEDEMSVIFPPILSALQQVHERGFIHGAATPENILLKKDGEPVLTNFANARLALAPRTDTLSDFISAGYAPPEYGETGGELGPWSDIYTLGATMYHCVNGRVPNPAGDRIAALSRNLPDPLQPLTQKPPAEYNEALCAAIDSMLALKTSDRPQSAAAVLTMLQQASEITSADTTQAIGDIPPSPATEKSNNKRFIIGAGAVLAAAGLLALGIRFQQPEERDPVSLTTEDKSQVGAAEEHVQTALKRKPRETDQRGEKSADEQLASATPKAPTDYPLAENAKYASREATGAVTAQDATPPETEQEPERVTSDTNGSASLDNAAITSDAMQKDDATAMDNTAVPAESTELSMPNGKRSEAVSIEAARTPTANAAAGMSDAGHSRIIAEHIAAAIEHMNANRLTTPAEGNALAHYNAILEIAPDNPDGLMGLERIVSHYGWLIKKAVDEGRFKHAWIYLSRARNVLPDAPALEEFKTKIEDAEAAGNRDS